MVPLSSTQHFSVFQLIVRVKVRDLPLSISKIYILERFLNLLMTHIRHVYINFIRR